MAPTSFGAGGLFGGGERYPLELARALAEHVECELVTFSPRPGTTRHSTGLTVKGLRPWGHLHGHPAHPVGGGGWGGLLPRLFHRFLAVSSYSARTLEAPLARTTIIYGGADPQRFFPGRERRSGVLFVGRLTPHKGLDVLIRALPEHADLLVAGMAGHDRDPPERDYPSLLHRLAEGRSVRFAGAIHDRELPELYRTRTVLVLPSVHLTCYGRRIAISELLGLVAIEAMASGTPVVASRVGGLGEVVQDGETGFLVEPGDVGELKDRLGLLLSDPALAGRMGARARDVAAERFTWAACAERCLGAYEQLVRDAT